MPRFRTRRRRIPTTTNEGESRDPPQRRIQTAAERQPPGFLIIGTQRGGTTSLHRYLDAHPEIGTSWRKEVHYFDRFYEQGYDWYLANFPRRGRFRIVGEASPFYMFDPRVPGRVAETLGEEVKFIVMLRNPVDRAFSMYQMKVRRGVEELDFEAALERERECLSGRSDPGGREFQHYSYVKRGLYAEQLERWFAAFPRERFHVIRSEDFYERPGDELEAAQRFLGIRPHVPERLRAHNLRPYSSELDPALRERLEEYFAPHNRRLYQLLDRDLRWERPDPGEPDPGRGR